MLPQLVENAVLADACRVRVHSSSLKIGNSSACNKGENQKQTVSAERYLTEIKWLQY